MVSDLFTICPTGSYPVGLRVSHLFLRLTVAVSVLAVLLLPVFETVCYRISFTCDPTGEIASSFYWWRGISGALIVAYFFLQLIVIGFILNWNRSKALDTECIIRNRNKDALFAIFYGFFWLITPIYFLLISTW